MIRYDLRCAKDHAFDAWFRDSSAFDAQAAVGELACPVCGSRKVEKALMTPGVPAKANRRLVPERPLSGEREEALRDALRRLREQVVENSDYVGADFPEEARRIYYKEADERGIYGEASLEEARSLLEEGITVLPLPPLPDDKN